MRNTILKLALGAVLALPVATALAHQEDDAANKPGEKLGTVHFATSCDPAAQQEFDRGMALFHSFWFDPAMQAFAQVAKTDPSCAMAYWGMALTRLGNPFAWPPAEKSLALAQEALAKARAAQAKTQRERDYIAALGAFYDDAGKVDHRTRAVAFEKAMERMAQRYPDDAEARILYALLLDATAAPSDKTFAQQLKAAAILEPLLIEMPDHPGVAHYVIHTYDYPAIAQKGLEAARRYASIAPSAPHALHMPAHIFTRLGYWDESIETNRLSADAAKAELSQTKLSEGSYNALHAMDYMVYAYLQQGRDSRAKELVDEMAAITQLDVENFPAAYALAASPARYALERGDLGGAAALTLHPKELSWHKFPQAEAVLVFARAVGAARTGNPARARARHRTPAGPRVGRQAALLGRADRYSARRCERVAAARRRQERRCAGADARGSGPRGRHRQASGDAGPARSGARAPRRDAVGPGRAGASAGRVSALANEGTQSTARLFRRRPCGGARGAAGSRARQLREAARAHGSRRRRPRGGEAGRGLHGEPLVNDPRQAGALIGERLEGANTP